MLKQLPYSLIAIFTLSIIASVFLQSQYLIGHDIGWELEIARMLLNGKTLYKDIIEVNFPALLWLRTFQWQLANLTSLSIISATVITHNILIFISCIWSTLLLYHYRKRSFITPSITLWFCLWLLPVIWFKSNQFGQKEHILIACLLPYLIHSAYSTRSAYTFSHYCTAIVASYGFMIKPLYALIVPAIMLYRWRQGRRIITPLETTIMTIGVGYSVLIYYLYPEYLTFTIPMIASTYSQAFSSQMEAILFQSYAALLPILYPLFLLNIKSPQPRITYEQLLLLVCLSIVFIQQKGWHYHFIPAVTVAMLHIARKIEYYRLTYRTQTPRCYILAVTIAVYMGYFISTYTHTTYHTLIASTSTQKKLRTILAPHHGKTISIISDRLDYLYPLKWYHNLHNNLPLAQIFIDRSPYSTSYNNTVYNLTLNALQDSIPELILITEKHLDWFKQHPQFHHYLESHFIYQDRYIIDNGNTLLLFKLA